MCGRTTSRHPDRFHQAFPDIDFGPVNEQLRPRFNQPPREPVVGVANDAPHTAAWLSWGLLPWWAKSWSEGSRSINAKAETVATRPSFRAAWKEGRRSVLFADGFLEWTTRDKKKIPELFEVDGGKPFALAGLWEDWKRPPGDPKAGERVRTATILTCAPNELARQIHDRMPVILVGDEIQRWLSGSGEEASALLRPFDAMRMGYHEVSPLVNKVGNDSPEVLEPPRG
jgi:putative SOS response-associated peptidase YedK